MDYFIIKGRRRRHTSPLPPLGALLLLTSLALGGELTMLGPSLVEEPAARVQYAAELGARVRCAARGEPPPQVTWLDADGAALRDLPGTRRVHTNGTLELLPTSGAYEPAAMTVRCRAANAHGVALSRDVTLLPVLVGAWEAVATASGAQVGGVAAVTCGATRHEALVRPALWYRADTVLHVDPPAPGSRYLVAGNTLLIREVRASNAGKYSCLVRHMLTGATRRSAPATLTVTTSAASSAPRLVAVDGELTVQTGQDVCLPCVASELSQPHYTWYREVDGRLAPVEAEAQGGWLWAGGAALCLRRVRGSAAGLWACRAGGAGGERAARVSLVVRGALRVAVSPRVLVAAAGGEARFTCAAPAGAALRWLHDGAAAGAGADLLLRGVTRAHRGVYQCVAHTAHDSAQAAAELRLGESSPELHYTFIEQALRAGGAVSLRCAASAAPPPRFSWLLDDQPIDHYRAQHRYFISSETSVTGDVVSVLNISSVSVTDGGRYTCRAHNEHGTAEHSARLNIYGPPSIRALGPVRVVAGANATIYCPYAGYPISSVSWWRVGAAAALGAEGRVSARGGALRLTPALPGDAGRYTCAAAAPQGPAARHDFDIQVRNPPKISPFMFSSELTEGSSVQVLCGVSSGDKPMYFTWLKDNAPLPPNLQIEEKSLNEFSLLMFSDLTAQHSGAYTCRVSNHAAVVNYTATLSVKVTPRWTSEPLDAAVLVGAPLLLECAATGHPAPTVTWFRRIGGEGEGGEQWQQVGGAEWGAAGAVRAHNGSLSAEAASRAHQAAYRCVADNGVGPPLIKHVNVTVHEPAHFEGSGGNVSSVLGRGVALSCLARGDAPLHVTWSRAAAPLDLTSYRWTVTEARTHEALRSTLQLRAAERADAGAYTCRAHNQYGRSEHTVFLHLDEPPEAPRRLLLGGVGSRWVRLKWGSPRGGAPRALTYTALYTALHALPGAEPRHTAANLTADTTTDDRIDAEGLYTWTARLQGLRPSVAYSLRLIASNHVGQSPHSEPLLFTTLEEAPTAAPQNVRVRAVSASELHVSWAAPPQESWNGELVGYVVTWREVEREGEEAGGAGRAMAGGWASAELTLAGLHGGARYSVTLRAHNRAGAGPPSPPAFASTPPGAPDRAPRVLSCEALSPRALRIRWAPLAASELRGYDLHYAPTHLTSGGGSAGGAMTARAGPAGEATLQGLRAATNYSVWVRARADAGLGPPSHPLYCTTADDVAEAVEQVRAVGCAADAVRVTWLAPAPAPLAHYTLYTRELGKVGGEWAQRVAARAGGVPGDEEWREVRGLRHRTLYEFWVSAATAAGAGPPSRPVTAAPAIPASTRISSFSRVVYAALGSRVRLRCAAVGTPPLRWRWSPLPAAHTVTDDGDLIIHKVEAVSGGNYTCAVHGGGGADTLVVSLSVLVPPRAPALRLVRAGARALQLAWRAPPPGRDVLLAYTLEWSRASPPAPPAPAHSRRLPPADLAHALTGLACGATYRVTLRAHNAVGASPPSEPLLARTQGDKARAPPGKWAVWTNSTTLRVNLLAWGGRCPVTSWSVALRAPPANWRDLPTDGETAEATNLPAGTWHEVRVVARSPAGDTLALYRAATHTRDGERLGEAEEIPTEQEGAAAEGGVAGAAAWRSGLLPALVTAALALLLALLAGVVLVRRRREPSCLRRECSLHQVCQPQPQLYSTEPGKRNGKTLTPPDVTTELHEISPYATFSMSEAAEAARGCALHLRTFGRAEPLGLAAPPPRPALHPRAPPRPRARADRDSDSESSGSPCAACAVEQCRADTSAEDTSCGAAPRHAPRARRRREPASLRSSACGCGAECS